MADRRRLITLSAGGRPILDLDLEVTSTYQAIRDTFAYVPGAQNQQGSREPGRYGGQVVVGEQNDNGTVSWQALVQGATPDVAASNIEALLMEANRSTRGRLLEWRPDGSSFSSYFRVAGPAAWKPVISWAQWQGAGTMVVEVTFPVRPLVLWDAMTIGDDFSVDSLADYTFDACTAADVTVPGGLQTSMSPVVGAAVTVERRARHTVRGYRTLAGQVTTNSSPGTTITGYKGGVLLRASSANTYIEAYVDDNGTSSRLRIDLVVAGVRTNKASTNLAARMTTSSTHWVRVRIEDNPLVIVAEHFTGTPTPMGAPTTTNTYTMSAPENASLPAGYSGWSWVPQHASARQGRFAFQPFTWRNLSLPQVLSPSDAIPGSAPALVDVLVSPSGGSAKPVWALVASVLMDDPASITAPLAFYEAESMTLIGTWASSSQPGTTRNGSDVRVTTSGSGSFSAWWTVSLGDVEADEFTDDLIDVEVWARVLVSSTNVNPMMRVFGGAYSAATGIVEARYSTEYGSAGKVLVKPSSGNVYRFVRLGTLPLAVAASTQILVNGTVDGGSSGVFGLDYVMLVAARRRAAGMTGVPVTDVAAFVPSTAEWTRRIFSDLSAMLETPDFAVYPSAVGAFAVGSHGLGGALIQPNPGVNRWLVKLSSLVPDDPTVDTTAEQLAHSATVSLDVTPRSYMLRGA